MNKTDLEVRPVYHRLHNRIEESIPQDAFICRPFFRKAILPENRHYKETVFFDDKDPAGTKNPADEKIPGVKILGFLQTH